LPILAGFCARVAAISPAAIDISVKTNHGHAFQPVRGLQGVNGTEGHIVPRSENSLQVGVTGGIWSQASLTPLTQPTSRPTAGPTRATSAHGNSAVLARASRTMHQFAGGYLRYDQLLRPTQHKSAGPTSFRRRTDVFAGARLTRNRNSPPGPGRLARMACQYSPMRSPPWCCVHRRIEEGAHAIIIGRVPGAIARPGAIPLLHSEGNYTHPDPSRVGR
jgi:hypothetical protein